MDGWMDGWMEGWMDGWMDDVLIEHVSQKKGNLLDHFSPSLYFCEININSKLNNLQAF